MTGAYIVHDPDIVALIHQLEDRLSQTLNTGLAGVNAAIAEMNEKFTRALLDQERRNSTFITGEKLSHLESRLEAHGVLIASAGSTISALEKRIDQNSTRITHLEESNSRGQSRILAGALNYAILFIFMLGSSLIPFALTHIK